MYDDKVALSLNRNEIAAFGEMSGGFFSWEPNCGPGRFEMMLDAMKLQDLVIAACNLWKRHPH
jgi:hypothetical protein